MRILNVFATLALCSFAFVDAAKAHVVEDVGIFGNKIQVSLLPKYSGANLIGIDLCELTNEADIGYAFVARRSFYRFDTNRITEDREWYRIMGYLSEAVIEVDNEYETQHWSISPEMATNFDRAARAIANQSTPAAEIRRIYETFQTSPFSVKAGNKEREGQRHFKWLSGLQKIEQLEIILARHPKYGNRYVARFAK
jgi:hypothetical protein